MAFTMLGSTMLHRLASVPGRSAVLLTALVAALTLAPSSVILHEYFEATPDEDLAEGARISSGTMPAAVRTPNGPVSAPEPLRPKPSAEPVYSQPAPSETRRYRSDPNTTDPGGLSYHEPFRPSVAPFKRLQAYDAVDENFDLTVWHPTLQPVAPERGALQTEQEFFGDLQVAANGNDPVRIASVAPGMRVLAAELSPARPFRLLRDGAENWAIRLEQPSARPVRLVMHLAAPHQAFAPRMVATSYAELAQYLPPVPGVVKDAATTVLAEIGVDPTSDPASALAKLAVYFRGFAESDQHPTATSGKALYLELSLSKKGVCRHRAYAFTVTALALGIPTRLVHNEAHAWVEVFGGEGWHRLNLGGASSSLSFEGEPPSGPPHRPPQDPLQWPPSAQRQTEVSSPSGTQGTAIDAAQPSLLAPSPSTPGKPAPPPPSSLPDATETELPALDAKAPEVSLQYLGSPTVRRGESVQWRGMVTGPDGPCAAMRVDLTLVRGSNRRILGSPVSDRNGRFTLSTTVPIDIDVGDYDVLPVLPADDACVSRTPR